MTWLSISPPTITRGRGRGLFTWLLGSLSSTTKVRGGELGEILLLNPWLLLWEINNDIGGMSLLLIERVNSNELLRQLKK